MLPRPLSVDRRSAVWWTTGLVVALVALVVLSPSSAVAATCSDYDTQAEAQAAGDTRDSNGNGVLCEALPCPCAAPGSDDGDRRDQRPAPERRASCSRPRGVRALVFSRRAYPHIRRHAERAIRAGWPRVLVVNRPGADARRDRLLQGVPTRAGFDRDEYPPAVGRGRANGTQQGLVRGSDPRGWRASVMYVPSKENRSHGSRLGAQLRGLCNGTRVRYVFR